MPIPFCDVELELVATGNGGAYIVASNGQVLLTLRPKTGLSIHRNLSEKIGLPLNEEGQVQIYDSRSPAAGS